MVQMRSRREQVDAHRYTTQRMNLALLMANPESTERPLRRVGMSIFASTMVMVIILGIFLLVGLLGFGSQDPERGNIIMDKDTGEIYIYEHQKPNDEDSPLVLFPVLNYTSALLALDHTGEDPPVQDLQQSSFDHLPKAHPIGIVGAPSAPTQSLDQDSDWNTCSIQTQDDHDFLFTQLAQGNLSGGETFDDNEAMLVHTEDQDRYLLWGDRRMAMPDESAMTAMGWQTSDSMEVTSEFLNTLLAGPDFWHPDRSEFGEESGVNVGGSEIEYGTPVTDGGNFYVLVEHDQEPQFAPIEETSAQLLDVDPELGDQTQITTAELSSVGIEAEVDQDPFPESLDSLRTFDGTRPTVCGVYEPGRSNDDAEVEITTFATAPSLLTDAADNQLFDDDGELVTGNPAQIVMQGGVGSLVQAQPRPGETLTPAHYLVDDLGVTYELRDYNEVGETKNKLGYHETDPVGIPSSFLELMPSGPNLDPVEALQQLDPSQEVEIWDPGDEEDGEGAEEDFEDDF